MASLKRTKIIATIGPASDSPEVMAEMIVHGMDLARLNFSHGTVADQQRRVKLLRECAAKVNREIGIIADLQGPKIRISKFKNGKVKLKIGDLFVLDADMESSVGTEAGVGIDYKQLPKDVANGDILLLDDGRIIFEVKKVQGPQIHCQVVVGGELSNNKGINRQGGGLSAEFLTDKDRSDLEAAIAMGVDYLAFSFPRSAEDIKQARQLIKNKNIGVIAKIERSEAVADIEAIIKASDAVMIARGDLGVEIGDAELPSAQKMIIHKCRSLDRAVITATQMMESMIENTIPTRAEVFDVANAVLDGTDAVMLSAETATGKHPATVINSMARVCRGAEANPISQISKHRLASEFQRVDEAIAMAVMYTANHMKIKAIVTLTESGSTPLWMSRIRSGIPIYGLSRHIATLRRMSLYRGVYPLHFDVTQIPKGEVNKATVDYLQSLGILEDDDLVILTKGDYLGVHGGTNSMKIIQVGKNF